jgi:hypothetical protein
VLWLSEQEPSELPDLDRFVATTLAS